MILSNALLSSMILTVEVAAASAVPSFMALCPPRPTTPACQENIFNNFMHAWMVDRDYEGAWRRHVDRNYIQHNPYVLSGRDNAIEALAKIVPSSNFTVLHTSFSDDKGWVHYVWEAANAQASVVVDVFRFNGTCIVEHWDVIQSRPADAVNQLALW